jgi:hypothetical protein
VHKKGAYFLLTAILPLAFVGCTHTYVPTQKNDIESLNAQFLTLERSIKDLKNEVKAQEEDLLDAFTLKQNSNTHTLKTQIQTTQIQLEDKITKELQEAIKSLKTQNTTTPMPQQERLPEKEKVVVYKTLKEPCLLAGKFIVGEFEDVRIDPPALIAAARIDSGAETSSIDARNIFEFQRDGANWVRFDFVDRKNNTIHAIETKIARYATVFQSSQKDKSDKRIVIKLKIDIGNHSDLAEFTLANRASMNFAVLIGRNILKDIAVIDISGKNLAPLIETKTK